jgi:hypothetical protein
MIDPTQKDLTAAQILDHERQQAAAQPLRLRFGQQCKDRHLAGLPISERVAHQAALRVAHVTGKDVAADALGP